MVNLPLIFLTGLLTGGLTCLALQGGLIVAAKLNRTGIIIFLISKIITYTILGFLLGILGSAFQLSITAKIALQFLVVIFMVGSALNILEVHPIFRHFSITPPRFLTKLLRGQSSPIILGAFTIFIPCGTTQAMMALAVGTGSPILGAAVMFAFILGTSPVFFILGNFIGRIGKWAAVILLILAAYTLSGALALSGINFAKTENVNSVTTSNPVIYIDENGYTPSSLSLKAGEHVVLTVTNRGGTSCIQAFTIPSLGIQAVIPVGTTKVIEFTVPNNTTNIGFMCTMGMYRGNFKIQ